MVRTASILLTTVGADPNDPFKFSERDIGGL